MRRVIFPCVALLLAWSGCGDGPRKRAPAAARTPVSARGAATRADPPATPATAAPAAAAPAAAREAPVHFASGPLDDATALRHLARAETLAFKPVGSTSTVFRTRLRAPIDAAFKAASVERPYGPASEVAAYRVARCLGMDGVPPAISRELPLSRIQERLEPESADEWPEIEPRLIVTPQGIVRGAAIYWIPELRELDFGGQPARATALAWLKGDGVLPEKSAALARSLSDLFAFDFVIGNGDRWSGGNVKGDAASTRVWVRDHDLAFAGHGPGRQRELFELISSVERFSRGFIGRLRALDRGCIERELAQDPATERGPLLSERQLLDVLDRRAALLSHVDSLIAERGEARVLVFD